MPRLLLFSALLMLTATPAQAYIGPGAGLGAVAFTIAVFFSVILLFIGFLWYPLRRLFRRLKTATKGTASRNDDAS